VQTIVLVISKQVPMFLTKVLYGIWEEEKNGLQFNMTDISTSIPLGL